MEINQTGLLGAGSKNVAVASGSLADNFDNFLILLTTQLQNQDPLSPMESTEFTNQLVQFASVEQQIKQNQSLEDLLAIERSNQAVSAVGFLGANVEAFGNSMMLENGSVDMRMDADGAEAGPSAAEVVNTLSEGELATVIARYGEERKARHVARAIVTARRERRIERTAHLADIVRRAVRRGVKAGRPRIDPATRTFQALRIYVNDELGELERGLHAAERLLAPSGRLAVVAFHSLEDRVVKAFLRERGRARPRGSRHLPESGEDRRNPTFLPLHRGTCRPSRAECTTNPRARSARLRAAERTEFPPWTARGGTA